MYKYFLKKYYGILVSLIILAVYIYTLAPSVVHIDSGELATVQATLGIAHPTGYPLFTIVGYLFLLIPLPFTKIYQANLLCALWCTAGVFMFICLSKLILDNINIFHTVKDNKAKASKNIISEKTKNNIIYSNESVFNNNNILITSALGGIILGFSKTYWLQSTSVEVYSLHLFLLISALYFFLKAYLANPVQLNKTNSIKNNRNWIYFSVILALGFSNHMSMIFILPGIAYLYFISYGFNKLSFTKIGIMLAVFFFTLFISYSFILIRANQNPLLNWGNPSNLRNLYFHISGKQFSGAMFKSSKIAEFNLINFFKSIPFEFAFGTLLFSIIGIIYSLIKVKRLFFFILFNVVITFSFAINYNIRDIFTYYLLAYIGLTIFIVIGLQWVLEKSSLKKPYYYTSIFIIVIIVSVQVYLNFGVSHRNLYTYEDYSKSVINSVDKNSIIFVSREDEWDYISSALTYFQNIENIRKDVVVLDCGLLGMPWFYYQTERIHPGFFNGLKSEIQTFSNAYSIVKSANSEDDIIIYMNLYHSMINKIITDNIGKRPIYFSPGFLKNEYINAKVILPQHYDFIPDLLLFKVVSDPQNYHSLDKINISISLPNYRNQYIREVEYSAAGVMAARAFIYDKKFNKTEEANRLLYLIHKNFPDYYIK